VVAHDRYGVILDPIRPVVPWSSYPLRPKSGLEVRASDSRSQAGKLSYHELTDRDGLSLSPMLPNKPRGVAWLNDHRGPQRHTVTGAVLSRTESGQTVDRRSTHAPTRKTLGRRLTLPIRS
jgi:hypothetical protein